MAEKLRLAIIGLGMAAKPHLEALAELKDEVAVSGVLTRTGAKAAATAELFGCKTFSSLEELVSDEGTDAALVLTPPNQRAEIVHALAAAGKHILMEKPVERTGAAARALVETCEAAGVTLGIVFQHRFRAGARRLAELIREGALGEIALARIDVPWWRDQDYYDTPGRGSYERDGGGVLISQAIHTLDLALSQTGPATSVSALTATTAIHRMESEDFAAAGLRFASGAVGSLMATTASAPGHTESIAIEGTKGAAILRGGALTVTWRDGREEFVAETAETGGGADPMAFPCDWHRDLIADFARAIRSGGAPAITGRAALRVHALIDAITASSREGRMIEVADMEAL